MKPTISNLIAAATAARPLAKKIRVVGMLIVTVGFLAAPMLMPIGAGYAQDARVTKSMAALQAETGKLGAPKVQGSDLSFGNTKVSNDVVDAVVKAHGGVATLFVKSGDQYVRVATTVKREDGTSAVGTALDANSRAMPKLKNGEAYYGDATIFGKTYVAGYEPIKDASGTVIGTYFVGYAK